MLRIDPLRLDVLRDLDAMLARPRAWWRNAPEAPAIRMDVSEDEKAYRVKAEIPGVRKEDIQVAVDANQVSISAESKRESEEKKGESVIRSERYLGAHYRAFTVARDVDPDKAEARYENGVLELVLPKKEGASPQRLAVK